MNLKNKIGIIGCGNMGSAIIERIKFKYELSVFDKDKSKTDKSNGVCVSYNVEDLVNHSDVVILAVKPQDYPTVVRELKSCIDYQSIISIAAGISTEYIEKGLGKIRVVRVMPNLPIKVGKGMICLCKGRYANQKDLDFAKELFGYMGQILVLEENLMNAATAVSGSGPGFFYNSIQDKSQPEWGKYTHDVFVPEFSRAARSVGFTGEQAMVLATVTAEGSLALLKETGLSPEVLCMQVTSKGGTTEAGIGVLHKGGSLEEAVKAALKRAEELSKKE